MIVTDPEGAFLMFDRWNTGRIELLCQSHMGGWGFVFKGRVTSLTRKDVLVTSDDESTRLTLSFLTDDLVFSFGLDDNSVPEGALVVRLPLRVRPREFADPAFVPGRRDILSFLSLTSPDLAVKPPE